MTGLKGPSEWINSGINETPLTIKERGVFLESNGFRKIGTFPRATLLRELQPGGIYEGLTYGGSDLSKHASVDILSIQVSSTDQVVAYKKIDTAHIAPLMIHRSQDVRNILDAAV